MTVRRGSLELMRSWGKEPFSGRAARVIPSRSGAPIAILLVSCPSLSTLPAPVALDSGLLVRDGSGSNGMNGDDYTRCLRYGTGGDAK